METWSDVEQFLQDEAARDLEALGDITPCLVAFRGDAPLFAAFWRPFPKGAFDKPFIELTALACPLDADRLALSIGARVWSLEDPIPPVAPEGDLRQRALCLHSADATVRPTRQEGALLPFDLDGGRVSWREPLRDVPRSWLVQALAVAVEQRAALRAPLSDIREQARRCAELGHRVYLAPAVADRLEVSPRP